MVASQGVQLWHGDALDVLASLPDRAMAACVTSPPYLDARSEYPSPTLEEFGLIFRELRRTVSGPALINVGRLFREGVEVRWWVALAETAERAGWAHLDTIAWIKPNGNPIHGNVLADRHEYVLVLGRPGEKIDVDDVRVPYAASSIARLRRGWSAHVGVKGDSARRSPRSSEPHDLGGRPPSYIVCDTGRDKGNPHPAPMARGLAADLVRLACPAGGWIVDPFAGSCNVGIEAVAAGRRFIGIDLNCHWLEHELAGGRLRQGSLLVEGAA